MAFKSLTLLSLSGLLILSGCAPVEDIDNSADERMIGKKLELVSEINTSETGEVSNVSIFDETTRKVHNFDLENMTHLRTFSVQYPENEHYVLQASNNKYSIDLTKKHISILKSDGQVIDNPVRFVGTPESAAFRSDLGLVVIYDDLKNVQILKLDDNGNVLKTINLGPVIDDETTILSGDFVGTNNLVLSTSDNSIVQIDITETLNQGKWVMSSLSSTTLSKIVWVAPVRQNADQVLLKTSDSIVLYQLSTNTVLDTVTIEDGYSVMKYSKNVDAHIILTDRQSYSGWTLDAGILKVSSYSTSSSAYTSAEMYYVKDSKIAKRTMGIQDQLIMSSHLNLNEDLWTITRSTQNYYYDYNGLNEVKKDRNLVHYTFSSGATLGDLKIADEAKVNLSDKYIFALFPSELGYARRENTESGEVRELKLFNLNHIKK